MIQSRTASVCFSVLSRDSASLITKAANSCCGRRIRYLTTLPAFFAFILADSAAQMAYITAGSWLIMAPIGLAISSSMSGTVVYSLMNPWKSAVAARPT